MNLRSPEHLIEAAKDFAQAELSLREFRKHWKSNPCQVKEQAEAAGNPFAPRCDPLQPDKVCDACKRFAQLDDELRPKWLGATKRRNLAKQRIIRWVQRRTGSRPA